MRTLSDALVAATTALSTAPLLLVEINWGPASSRLSSFGDLAWSGSSWDGGGITVGGYDSTGAPTSVTIVDSDFTYRTLMLANGLRDRAVRIWQADASAIGDADPELIFDGFSDGGNVASGRLQITLVRTSAGFAFTPRERVGPLVGVNFTASPGEVVKWGNQRITLES